MSGYRVAAAALNWHLTTLCCSVVPSCVCCLQANTDYFRQHMAAAGFDIRPGNHPIVVSKKAPGGGQQRPASSAHTRAGWLTQQVSWTEAPFGSAAVQQHKQRLSRLLSLSMSALTHVLPPLLPLLSCCQQPIMLGDAALANRMAAALLERGVYVVGFSYPVVPKGKARIRVQLSAGRVCFRGAQGPGGRMGQRCCALGEVGVLAGTGRQLSALCCAVFCSAKSSHTQPCSLPECAVCCAPSPAAHDRGQLDTAIAAFTAVGKELGVI